MRITKENLKKMEITRFHTGNYGTGIIISRSCGKAAELKKRGYTYSGRKIGWVKYSTYGN